MRFGSSSSNILSDFISFVRKGYIVLPAIPAFFPYADQVVKFVKLTVSDEDGAISTLNLIVCSFVFFFIFAFRRQFKSVSTTSVLFLIGAGISFFAYQYAEAPNLALISLGVNAGSIWSLSNATPYAPALYIGIFACLTGAFTAITATLFPKY